MDFKILISALALTVVALPYVIIFVAWLSIQISAIAVQAATHWCDAWRTAIRALFNRKDQSNGQ